MTVAAAPDDDRNLLHLEMRGDSRIYCLAFSPNGKTIASAGSESDATGFCVRIRDVSTGETVFKIPTPLRNQMKYIVFSPSGRSFVATDYVGTNYCHVSLGQAPQISLFRQFENVSTPARHGIFLTDDEFLFITSRGVASLWNVKTRQSKWFDLWSKAHYITAAAVDHRKKHAVWIDRFAVYVLPNMFTDFSAMKTIDHKNGLTRIALDPSGVRIIGSMESRLMLFNLQTEKVESEWEAHSGQILALAALSSRKGFVSADSDGVIKAWDWRGNLVRRIQASDGAITSLAINHDESLLASGGQSKRIQLWDLKRLYP
jgi:WD40 repeat protein